MFQPEELVGTGNPLPVLTTGNAQWKSFATDAAKAIHMNIANWGCMYCLGCISFKALKLISATISFQSDQLLWVLPSCGIGWLNGKKHVAVICIYLQIPVTCFLPFNHSALKV